MRGPMKSALWPHRGAPHVQLLTRGRHMNSESLRTVNEASAEDLTSSDAGKNGHAFSNSYMLNRG